MCCPQLTFSESNRQKTFQCLVPCSPFASASGRSSVGFVPPLSVSSGYCTLLTDLHISVLCRHYNLHADGAGRCRLSTGPLTSDDTRHNFQVFSERKEYVMFSRVGRWLNLVFGGRCAHHARTFEEGTGDPARKSILHIYLGTLTVHSATWTWCLDNSTILESKLQRSELHRGLKSKKTKL